MEPPPTPAVSWVVVVQRPQVASQKPTMKSAPHFPKFRCCVHVNLPGSGTSTQAACRPQMRSKDGHRNPDHATSDGQFVPQQNTLAIFIQMDHALVSTVAAAQRPQLLLQKPFMKSALHLPKAFCSAHVYLPSGGSSVQVPAAQPTGCFRMAAQPHDVQSSCNSPCAVC